ncbi:MAG: enoyl-CoA hydratase/isomerase family protein [Burkholderiales bacterium]|nr:enoyl-CoA hydratase/isomerase family protein [Burkholderiales bacterium]
MSTLRVTGADGASTLTLDRPDRANALDSDLVEALHGALDDLERSAPRFVLLAAEGRNFCAGFDFSGFEEASVAELCWRFVRIEQLLQRLAHAPWPVAALVQGPAYGAGADLVVACQDSSAAGAARFRMPGWKFGLALGTRRLIARAGAAAAHDFLAQARTIDAAEARALGLVRREHAPGDEARAVATMREAASALAPGAARRLAAITVHDTRAQDMASLVESLTDGDLKARIRGFRAG